MKDPAKEMLDRIYERYTGVREDQIENLSKEEKLEYLRKIEIVAKKLKKVLQDRGMLK